MSTLAVVTLVTIACAAVAMIAVLLVDRISIERAIALWRAEEQAHRKKDKK